MAMSSSPNPGPLIQDLLFLNDEHRAHLNFYNTSDEPDKTLMVRRCDQSFFEFLRENPIPLVVMEYIRLAGFGGVLDCGFHKVDRALITALVERWRPETHTFHLPIGEATVTLQDVQVLWGLNVEGAVVTGTESMNFETVRGLCENFMGISPSKDDVKGSTIKIPWMKQFLSYPLPIEPTQQQIEQRARLYIMILIGGVIFSDLSGHRVPVFYIYNLLNLQQAGTLSWGSAVLAYLYRCLCRASKGGVMEVSGPLMLLQFWAWERFPAFRPQVRQMNYSYTTVYGTR